MKFGEIIGAWYEKSGRELPMRRTRDPYATWIAEIILQQTRMEQGLPYLERFLERFPDLPSLARATENQVLTLWQGLGYYSRARNLHATAIYINEELGGSFPSGYEAIMELRGIGPYTAAAIASWCFGVEVAAVDGNVARVLARIYAYPHEINTPAGQRDIAALAREVLGQALSGGFGPGVHNQAMIDLGATVCTPRQPACEDCPLHSGCEAFGEKLSLELPRKRKAGRPRDRWFNYCLVHDGDTILLEKRGEGDIWSSLYQLPLIESKAELSDAQLGQEIPEGLSRIYAIPLPGAVMEQQIGYRREVPLTKLPLTGPVRIKHQLSHQTIHASFTQVPVPDTLPLSGPGLKRVQLSELPGLPLPQLIHNYLRTLNFSYI